MDTASTLMKAIGQDKLGELTNFKIVDVPKPVIGPKDLLVKIKGSSLNPVDCKKAITGLGVNFTVSSESPLILGFDASGVVEDIGSDVVGFKKDDEVYYSPTILKQGTFADYHAIDYRAVALKPKSLNFVESSSIPLCYITAYEGLTLSLGIPESKESNSGKIILIVNAAGGVGTYASQIAKNILGLTVIGTCSRDETANFAMANCCDYIINHRHPLKEELEKLGIRNIDYIYHCHELNQNYIDQFVDILNPRGKICVITFEPPITINNPWLLMKAVSICYEFISAAALFDFNLDSHGKILSKAAELIDQGVIKHGLKESYKLTAENMEQAMIKQNSGKMIGKCGFEHDN